MTADISPEPNPYGRPRYLRDMSTEELIVWNNAEISQRAYDRTWLDVVCERTNILDGHLGRNLKEKCLTIENELWTIVNQQQKRSIK